MNFRALIGTLMPLRDAIIDPRFDFSLLFGLHGGRLGCCFSIMLEITFWHFVLLWGSINQVWATLSGTTRLVRDVWMRHISPMHLIWNMCYNMTNLHVNMMLDSFLSQHKSSEGICPHSIIWSHLIVVITIRLHALIDMPNGYCRPGKKEE